jgi:hypothetical protein
MLLRAPQGYWLVEAAHLSPAAGGGQLVSLFHGTSPAAAQNIMKGACKPPFQSCHSSMFLEHLLTERDIMISNCLVCRV